MAASYPGAKKTYTDEVNKEDLADADVVNSLQDEVEAIEAELGTDPAGSLTDVTTRLAVMMADNGSLQQGTSFPGTPVDGQIFYRTDENTVYVYNGSSWDSQGQSLSNVIYEWHGSYTAQGSDSGLYIGTSLTPAAITTDYMFIITEATSATTYLTGKFYKVAGINTISIHANIWQEAGGNTVTCTVDIGGESNTVTNTGETAPAWATADTIDVSGLTDTTLYDIAIKLHTASNIEAYLGAIMLIAS